MYADERFIFLPHIFLSEHSCFGAHSRSSSSESALVLGNLRWCLLRDVGESIAGANSTTSTTLARPVPPKSISAAQVNSMRPLFSYLNRELIPQRKISP